MALQEVLPKQKLHPDSGGTLAHESWYKSAMERLIHVVQDLSHTKTLEEIMLIVRDAARSLTGADGATFVLRDDDQCYYAEENAISPLWKGKRFPMSICISGWVMMNAKPVVIEDIYQDERIPKEAYRPTFVKSLAMVPIRTNSPIGAIGNYWAEHRVPTNEEMKILQALADTTSVALENVQLYTKLKDKVKALQESNYELSRFAWVASHDLQEPLRMVSIQIELFEKRYGQELDERAKGYLATAREGARRQQELIESLLVHASAEKIDGFKRVDLNEVIKDVLKNLDVMVKSSKATVIIPELPMVKGDKILMTRVFQNLISNAIKFSSNGADPTVRVYSKEIDGHFEISVEDNGIGIEEQYFDRIFGFFQRLNSRAQYPGSGIGLATCKKIIELHDGKLWVESQPGLGSRFYFTLNKPEIV